MPLVSVVLIFLNEERFLEEAVQSLRDQTLQDWELILVDDGSTDRSTQIARDLAAGDKRISYVDHPGHQNRGMSASRNLGVAHGTAHYLAFLDGDDVWVPAKLAEQVHLLDAMPDVAMISGAILFWHSWDPASKVPDYVRLTGGLDDRRIDPPEAALTFQPLGAQVCGGINVLVRRSVFEEVGGFEEHFRGIFEDQAFLIKVFLRHSIYVSSRPWLLYRQHDASCCAQTTRTQFWRLRSAFLDWIQTEVEQLEDSRVHAALRRARREVPYRKLTALAGDHVYDRIRARLPEEFKQRVKRTLGRARQTT